MMQTFPIAHMRRRALRNAGFTLVELMIVVLILGVLAAVAYPGYTEYARKAWRAEARAALLAEMQQQERYYTQMNQYRAEEFKSFSGDSDAGSKYSINAGVCAGATDTRDCVKLTATLKSNFNDGAVGNITLDSTGKKDCSGDDKDRCWR